MRYQIGDIVKIISGGYSGNIGVITSKCDAGYTIHLTNGMTVWFYQFGSFELVK